MGSSGLTLTGVSDVNRGVLLGAGAYGLWGLGVLYWPLLSPSSSPEVLAHRTMWSLLAVLLFLSLARQGWSWLPTVLRNRRQLLTLAGAAAAIALNWLAFIYAVNSGNALEASLAYFINPLVTVVFGVLIFAERLRRAQWAAVVLGGAAVVVLAFAYGSLPWLALVMASSFAVYGVLKKFTRLDGLKSLTVETAILFPPSLGFVLYLQLSGAGTFLSESVPHALLLVGSGLVTALPLLLFGAAAYRVPLSLLGLLQFIAPTLMFLAGWLVFGEEMPLSRWVGFALVWCALSVFAVDLVRNARMRPAPAEPALQTSPTKP